MIVGGGVSIAISLDSKFIVSGSDDKTIRIWSTFENGNDEKIKTLKGHHSGVYSVAINLNGKYIFSGGDDKIIKIWRL